MDPHLQRGKPSMLLSLQGHGHASLADADAAGVSKLGAGGSKRCVASHVERGDPARLLSLQGHIPVSSANVDAALMPIMGPGGSKRCMVFHVERGDPDASCAWVAWCCPQRAAASLFSCFTTLASAFQATPPPGAQSCGLGRCRCRRGARASWSPTAPRTAPVAAARWAATPTAASGGAGSPAPAPPPLSRLSTAPDEGQPLRA